MLLRELVSKKQIYRRQPQRRRSQTTPGQRELRPVSRQPRQQLQHLHKRLDENWLSAMNSLAQTDLRGLRGTGVNVAPLLTIRHRKVSES
jgi:hypothetical protein